MRPVTTSTWLAEVLRLSSDVEMPLEEKARRYYTILNDAMRSVEAGLTALEVYVLGAITAKGGTLWSRT